MYEMKIDDEGMPLVRNGSPHFSKPLFSDGQVYPNAHPIADELDVTPEAVMQAVRQERPCCGWDVRRATADEVREHLLADKAPPVFLVPDDEAQDTFVACVWPWGETEVRLSAGGPWRMTVSSLDDLPPAIRDHCRVLGGE